MELTEDEIIEKYGKHCGNCNHNCLSPYAYEFICVACGFNVIKTKHELSKIQRKKINFIKRLKNAEQKIFCNCIGVYKNYEGNDYDKIYEVLSILKNKLKINNILIEIYKDMLENPNFEQDHYPRTATSIYKIGHDSIRLLKWLAYYHRSYYENINYYDMMGSILKHLNEIS